MQIKVKLRSIGRDGLTALFVSLTLLFFAGCSGGEGGYDGPEGDVHGKVTYKGKAVPAGTSIQFSSEKGFNNAATLDDEGGYEITKLPVGTYKISLTPPVVEQPDDANVEAPPEPPPPFPGKYTQAETSGESFEVKEGDNEYNLEIKD